MVEKLCPLCIDSCLIVYPSTIHRINQMRCLKCLFKGFCQPNVRPHSQQSHLCLPWRLLPLRCTPDDRQSGHRFFVHFSTQLLNGFNNYISKIILLNNLTMIQSILFEHYSHCEPKAKQSVYLLAEIVGATRRVAPTLLSVGLQTTRARKK